MDITAITLAKENKIPIVIFSILQKDSLIEIIDGKGSFQLLRVRFMFDLKIYEEKMEKAIDVLKRELSGLRTGRASTSL